MKTTVTHEMNEREFVSRLASRVARQLEMKQMPLFDELKTQIQGLKDDAANEHVQVMAALDALQLKLVDSLDADQKAEINALFAETKAAIGGIYDPAPTEQPTPTEPPAPVEPAPVEPTVNPDEPPPAPEMPSEPAVPVEDLP